MEEIIINGVDVSGCCVDKGLHCFWEGGSCKDNPDCIYKQLKRKEAECEALMEEKAKLNLIIDRLLKAGGYSEDTCNPYDFEEVYQDLEFKINQFEEYHQALKKIDEKAKKYDANVGDTIIANPIQDLYDISQIIKEYKG